MDITSQTFEVMLSRKAEARNELLKLERKAVKAGVPFSFSFGEPFTKKVDVGGLWKPHYIDVKYVPVTVTGSYPRVGSYSFLGRLEFVATGVVVRSVPGIELDPKYRDAKPHCEHCGTTRRRNDVFVVRNDDDGTEKVVGRSCLADYVGGNVDDVLRAFSWFKKVSELGDEYSGFGAGFSPVAVLDVLALCSVFIKRDGWIAKSAVADGESSTSSLIEQVLVWTSRDPDWIAWRDSILAAKNADDEALAAATLAWVRDEMQIKNDYQHNLKVLLSSDLAAPNHFGLIASAVPAYMRHMEMQLKMKHERANKAGSQHVGKVGERLKGIPATLLSQRNVGSSLYGDVIFIEFMTDDGNVIMWKTGHGCGVEVGKRVLLTGSVKKHETYNGVAQTWLTRCKVTGA